ncbi:hypothetical protein T03_15168 [Trichinella britovi]|uniref:Uncharacterized protein n=1 Tax=Trichinella britovi TaxID=45882 RepID=A0A0V1DAP2_TRIBR|nr:hypothetical protein T03_15168 [Trichinella britovi]
MGQFDPENNRRVKVGILAILIHWKASHFFRYMSRTTRLGILKQDITNNNLCLSQENALV